MKISTAKQGIIYIYIINLIISTSSLSIVDGNIEELGVQSEIVGIQIRKSRSIEEDFYDVSYRVFDEDINVRLRRDTEPTEDTSIYARNFKVVSLDMSPTGETIVNDETPSRKDVLDHESRIYVDPKSDTAVQIKKNADGNVTISGIVQGRTIVPMGAESGTTSANGTAHKVTKQKIPKFPDFVDKHRKTKKLNGRASFPGIPLAEPEVFVVLDFDNSMLHDRDKLKIMDYLTVLFKSVNNRFATLKDTIKINFKITGLLMVINYNQQPYIEDFSIMNGKGYDIVKVLDSFAKWMYTNQKLVPSHDLAALLTGKDMYTLDDKGKYSDGVTGYAYVKGACWVNDPEKKYMGTSVTEDIGGYWFGVFSIAHEFAHNLGAPHDGQRGGGEFGDPSTLDCPWQEGYMMSYDGWGMKNKFFFSPCSARLMKNFLVSNGATCMKLTHGKSHWKESTRDVGDKLSMKAMCIKFLKRPDAYVDPTKTPSDLCKNLVCRYPVPPSQGQYGYMTLNHAPGDHVPCSKGARCIDGECIPLPVPQSG